MLPKSLRATSPPHTFLSKATVVRKHRGQRSFLLQLQSSGVSDGSNSLRGIREVVVEPWGQGAGYSGVSKTGEHLQMLITSSKMFPNFLSTLCFWTETPIKNPNL
jgi:hypothetical protein